MLSKSKEEILNNPHFCMAPWVHTYLSPQSERRLCCASREKSSFVNQYIDSSKEAGEKYVPETLEQYWNNENLKSIRRRMLNGEKLSECAVCDENILSLSTYRSWFTKELFSEKLDDVIQFSSDDGHTDLKTISFDYRFNNLCNYKCITCGDQFSSSWESENKQNGDYEKHLDNWLKPENKLKIKDFHKNVVEPEFAQAIREKRIREIYWVGGEPLLWTQHWQYMQEIVDLNYADKVFVRYNTNLSVVEKNGTHLFHNLLPHFKSYMVSASIDGAGEIGEFIRSGLNWTSWLKNFEEGVLSSKGRPDHSIFFDITISLPSLFCIEELLDEALRLDVRTEVKVIYGFDPFVILHPLAVPRKIFEPFIDDLISRIEKKVTHKQFPLLNTLKDLKKRKNFEEQFPENYKKEFFRGREYLQKIAKRRNQNLNYEKIYAQCPAILEWWSQHE